MKLKNSIALNKLFSEEKNTKAKVPTPETTIMILYYPENQFLNLLLKMTMSLSIKAEKN